MTRRAATARLCGTTACVAALISAQISVASAGSGGNLQYLGGPVDITSTNYVIFWEPPLPLDGVAPGYNAAVTSRLLDIGGSGLYGILTQYYQVVNGTTTFIADSATLGGTWVDTSPYLTPLLTDADIQNEVLNAMLANGWTTGPGKNFLVVLGPGAEFCAGTQCSGISSCAYHSSFPTTEGLVAYAGIAYPQLSCETPGPFDIGTSGANLASGVLFDMVTDPDGGQHGWADSAGTQITEKCSGQYSNGVQEEWSNRLSGCSTI